MKEIYHLKKLVQQTKKHDSLKTVSTTKIQKHFL